MDGKQYDVKQTEEYVSYVLTEDIYSNLEYKVLQNQESRDFLTLHLLKLNGKMQFFYPVPPMYYPLALKCSDMEPQVLFSVIDALDRVCTEIEKNGFLKLEHLELNLTRIFIEASSGKLQLIYLPVTEFRGTMHLTKDSLMRELVKELLLHNVNLKVSGRIQRLNADLQNNVIPFSQIMANLRNGLYDALSQEAYFDDPGAYASTPVAKYEPYLVVVENQQRIPITKPMFLIGKNSEQVDGVIYNHNEVSRRHCAIQMGNGRCELRDEGSTNGTYLNFQRVSVHEWTGLKNGDRIRLGECDLVFYEG